jgi:hypothetical protein
MFELYSIYQEPGWSVVGLVAITIWVTIWKGIALWFAAGKKQKKWFIVLLVLNTLGLLPIIYLIWFKNSKKGSKVKIKS